MFNEIMKMSHQWIEGIRNKYSFDICILQDTDDVFRVILETDKSMAELLINKPDFAPYRYVSFQVYSVKETAENVPMFCFYDDEVHTVKDMVDNLNLGIDAILRC